MGRQDANEEVELKDDSNSNTMNPNDSFVVDDDDNRRISAASSSSNDSKSSANSSRSSNGNNVKIPQKRKMSSRPSTAPVKKQSSSSSSSHRASSAPSKGSNGNTTEDASSSNVRVVARLRPLSTKEKNEINNVESIRANIHSSSISILDNTTNDHNSNNNNSRQFDFDAVFEPNSSQEEVYKHTIGDMITKSIFRGYNATILAYGQVRSRPQSIDRFYPFRSTLTHDTFSTL